jgi:hypothetical protein
VLTHCYNWSHLCALQAASSLPVVRSWSQTPRISGETEHSEYPNLLQLQVERWRNTTSNQLQGLQPRRSRVAAQKKPSDIKPGTDRENFRFCSAQLRASEAVLRARATLRRTPEEAGRQSSLRSVSAI